MRCLSAFVAYLLFMQSLPAQEGPGKLNIVVVEGEGAINNIRQRTAREPIVEVQDENNRPVAGAVVVFTITGRSGLFPNGSNTLTVMTDQNGRAVARGLQARAQGRMEIRVNASSAGRTASATISQTNVAAAAAAAGAGAGGLSLKAVAIILAVAGAAAATGVVVATRNGETTPAPTPTTITPGTGTVGGPR